MRFRYWYLGMALAASFWLAAGCSTPSARSGPSPASGAEPASLSEKPASNLVTAQAHYASGVVHELRDETEAALQDYFLAAQNDPDDDSLVLEVSRRLLQHQQVDKALEVLVLAAGRPGVSGAVMARLGQVYAQTGKRAEAQAANRAAVAKSPKALAGYQNLFLNYLRDQQAEEAMKVLDDAAGQSGVDAEFLVNLAELYGNLGLQAPAQKTNAYGKALALLVRVEKLNPTNAPLVLQLADNFNALGDASKAAQYYLEALRRLPEAPVIRDRLRKKLAGIYLRGSDHRRAVEQLEAILRDEPTNAEAYYYLASIAYEERRLAEAADYFGKTVLLSPEFEQAYYDLALAQVGLNKPADALSTLDRAKRKFQQSFPSEWLAGLAYMRQKAYNEAVQHFTTAEVIALATEPSRLNEDFYFELGAAYERKGDCTQAAAYFEKCLQLAPKFPEALNYLGYMWAEQGTNLDRARALIEQAVQLEPKNPAYLDSLGWVLFKLNQPQAALEKVLKAIELTSEPDSTLYDHLGDIYAVLKQPDKAREAWRKSIALEPSDQVKKKIESGGIE